MPPRNFNNVTTIGSLTGPVAASATALTTTGFTGFPAVPFTITLDRNTASEEICLVTGAAGGTLTVTRGYDGTAGQAHSAGATVEHTAISLDFTESNVHTNATLGVHGVTGFLVGAQGAQTIYDKTIVSPVLQADVAAGDAAVTYVPSAASARNQWRAIGPSGADVVTVTATGAATVNALTTATTLHAQGATTLDAALAVGGASTFTGAVAANNGITVPTGKKATLVDAPAAGTDAANKTYVDAGDTAARAYADTQDAAFGRHRGNGTAYPGSPVEGDTFRRTDLGYTARYDGTQWIPIDSIVGKMWRTAGTSGLVSGGAGTVLVLGGNRVNGGVAYAANKLTVPLAALYRVRIRGSMTGGTTNGWNASFQAVRSRSAVADVTIATTGTILKNQAEDILPNTSDIVPLAAGDQVSATITIGAGSGFYGGTTEVDGAMLSLEYAGPLNGVTPL